MSSEILKVLVVCAYVLIECVCFAKVNLEPLKKREYFLTYYEILHVSEGKRRKLLCLRWLPIAVDVSF